MGACLAPASLRECRVWKGTLLVGKGLASLAARVLSGFLGTAAPAAAGLKMHSVGCRARVPKFTGTA